MAKISAKYEVLYIIDATIEEEQRTALVEKFKAMIEAEGTLTSVDEWGKRRLAYPINDLTEGYYVLVNFKSAPTFPLELERVFGITDGILRNIVIKHDEKKLAKKAAAPAVTEAPAEAAEATDAE